MDIMQILLTVKDSVIDFLRPVFGLIPDFPMYALFLIAIYGVYLIFLKGESSYIVGLLQGYLESPQDEDALFLQLGLKITANKYTFLLYVVSFFIFILIGARGVANGDIGLIILGGLICGALIYFLRPREVIYGGMRSPFVVLIEKMSAGRKKALEMELFNTVTILKNLAIAQEKSPVSADLILEKLMDNSKKLKPIFAEVITIYRQGDKKRAFKYFSEAIGTRNAKSFALTLDKIDVINPTELKTQVIALQEVMAEERFTQGMEKAESKGNLIYALATLCGFICLLNFIFVCVLSDALSMLGDIF